MCAAIIHANRLDTIAADELKKCIETLIAATHYKPYHSSLAYTFLLEILDKIDANRFHKIMWPLMRVELRRGWEKQNINTVHFLIQCQAKYPEAIDSEFLSSSLHTEEILSAASYKHLSRLFWQPVSIMGAVTHPSYEAFGKFLANRVAERQLLDFWKCEINEILVAQNKYKEIVTVRLLTIIFDEAKIQPKTALALLSHGCISLLVKSLRNGRLQKSPDCLETLFAEFFDAIEKYMRERMSTGDDTDKITLIRKFIDFPGTLLIEKYTQTRIIHRFVAQLKSAGVQQLFAFYKSILLDRHPKNPKMPNDNWLHTEKEHCVQMLQTLLQHKSIHGDTEWRAEQLQFLLKFGLFYVNTETEEIVKQRDSHVLPNDLAHRVKQAFYSSLQTKSANIEAERATLWSIVEFCHRQIANKSLNKHLRHALTDETAIQAWHKMYATVTAHKKQTSGKKQMLYTVFDILLMHMGLQLFVDAKLAIFSIDDLQMCLERSQSKLKAKQAKTKGNSKALNESSTTSNEAEWIEVVVDLFLQLLSQNKNFLRTVVDNVFPELCPNLTPAAVDQILMMLDTSEKNPLTSAAAAPAESDEDEEDDEEEQSDDSDANEFDESSEDDDDENLTEEDGGEDEEDGITASDQLRSAVSQALGSALPETDTESVDLNDMNDEEVERLDTALSDAFKLMRSSKMAGDGSGQTGKSKKKTKLERATNTTVMHFRIRVLDLIEIYLKTSPALAITLNILTDLIPMYEQCVGNKDQQALVNRLQRVLRMLLNLREFTSIDDVSEIKLYELFQSIINVKENPIAINEQNKLRSNLCSFLISVSQLLKSPDPILLEAIALCLENFLKVRNPKVPFTVFADIFKTRWMGVWRLGQVIAAASLLQPDKCRPFRRSQAIDLLCIIYKNHAFIEQNAVEFNEYFGKIEIAIQDYIQWAAKQSKTNQMNFASKEFSSLLILLQEIHKCAQQIGAYKCSMKWPKIGAHIQSIRQKIHLDSYQSYVTFCKRFDIEEIKNNEIVGGAKAANKRKLANGVKQNGNDDDNEEQEVEQNGQAAKKQRKNSINGNENANTKKRKTNNDDNVGGDDDELSDKRRAKLDKKLKKQNRLKISSIGLDDGVSFAFTASKKAATNGDDMDTD